MPLGALAGDAIAQAVGVRRPLLIGAIGVLLSTMWLVVLPVRRLRELPHTVKEMGNEHHRELSSLSISRLTPTYVKFCDTVIGAVMFCES